MMTTKVGVKLSKTRNWNKQVNYFQSKSKPNEKDRSFKASRDKNKTQLNLIEGDINELMQSTISNNTSRNPVWNKTTSSRKNGCSNKSAKSFQQNTYSEKYPKSNKTSRKDVLWPESAYYDEEGPYCQSENGKKLTRRYSQRKESISSSSTISHNTSYKSKSKIPVPNAVKDIVKAKELVSSKNSLKKEKSQPIRQPYGAYIKEKETFEYSSADYQSTRPNMRATQESQMHELEPTILDYSSEDFCEDSQSNLVVNLEDLVNEEYYINHISEAIHKKSPLSEYCRNWWKVTEVSSVKEMQIFFEESSSK